MLNHFQKTYVEVLADLIGGMGNTTDVNDCAHLIHNKVASAHSYLLDADTELTQERQLCERLMKHMGCEKYEAGILSAIQNAKELTHKKIINAPYRIASDFKEASGLAIAFVQDKNRRDFAFSVDTGGSTKSYIFFKLPYNEHIDLLYGEEHTKFRKMAKPGSAMKYLGFFSTMDENAYCLEEPLSSLYWFSRKHTVSESTTSMRGKIMQDIRQTAMERIFTFISNTAPPDRQELLLAVEEARQAYQQGKALLDFTERIDVPAWHIQHEDYIRYVDDPAALVSEEVNRLFADYAEGDLARLWVAYSTAQRMLDQIVARSGIPAEWNSAHKTLDRFILDRMEGRPVFIVANGEYGNTCRWCIVRAEGEVNWGGTPLPESTYRKNWIAFEHEPPQETILAWQSTHSGQADA